MSLAHATPGNPVDTTKELDATVVLNRGVKTNVSVNLESETLSSLPSGTSGSGFAERFQFICDFSGGGMGKISKARDLAFDRVIAVKSLRDEFQNDAETVKAFIEECRLNAKLDHPSIVPVYDLGRGKSGSWEVAMKFINGSSLNRFISMIRETYDKKKVSVKQEHHALLSRLEYFLKICAVVEYCHSLKVVHGDIKPDNILLGKFGEVYLMDWGCARPIGSVPENLTGTPNFLPPEFLETHVVTPQVDVYSLGMVLFEMATLRRGKTSCSVGESQSHLTCCDVNNPDNYCHYLPSLKICGRLKAIILKALNPDPRERYETVDALASDVRHFIYDEEVSAAPDHLFQTFFRLMYRHRMKTVFTAGGIFLLLCGMLFYSYYRANVIEQQKTTMMMQRLRLQAYTSNLAAAVEKNFLAAQAQLLLFADNLIEDVQEDLDLSGRFYDVNDYKSGKTSPPGMILSPYYGNPINLKSIVRFPPEKQVDVSQQRLLGPNQFITLCRKIIGYDLKSSDVNEFQEAASELLTGHSTIQRLFVHWANDVRYSYPGMYESQDTRTYRSRWLTDAKLRKRKKIAWSSPYIGLAKLSPARIACRYPMYGRGDDEYLGVAGLELRLEKLVYPVMLANALDPVHELYMVDNRNNILTVVKGTVFLYDKNSEIPSNRMPQEVILNLAERLKDNQMQQFEAKIQDQNYFVAGAVIKTVDCILIQMIEFNAMKTHDHRDVNL